MDLEELTNKQLRQKCLEYGLPNVPITDTNKKLLIRRLTAAMNGTTTTTKKPTTPKASTPNNRRKTVHATITTTVSSGDEDDFVVKTQRTTNANADARRRQTVAPVATSSPPKPKPSAPKHVNERIIPIGFDSVRNSTRIGDTSAGRADDRLRRSVSLTKTGVLTTSYSTETTKVPLHTTYEQADDMEDDEYDEPEDELDDVDMENVIKAGASKVYTHPSYSGYNQQTSSYNVKSFVTPSFSVPAAPPTLQPQTSSNKLYPDLHGTGLQNDYYNSFDGMRASHSSSARQTNLGFSHNAPTSYMPSSSPPSSPPPSNIGFSRQTLAGGGNSSYGSSGILNTAPYSSSNLSSNITKRYTTGTKRHTARAVDDELAASSSDDQYEAPYLSKFSRNLENLQPEPIYKRSSAAACYSPLGPKRRRGAYEDEDSSTLSQLWTTLEQKYNLKTAFYFVLVFVIAVFIYVFFLQ